MQEQPGPEREATFSFPNLESPERGPRRNGSFLSSIDAGAASSELGRATKAVAAHFFGEGRLAYALRELKDNHLTTKVSELWQNSALGELATKETIEGFDDTTSNGNKATKADYLEPAPPGVDDANSVNEDGRFKGLRPKDLVIKPEQKPVMAVVALDPKALKLDKAQRDALLEKVKTLRKTIMTDKQDADFSPELQQALSASLLANDTFITLKDPEGAEIPWSLPFDKIAALKAMYTLLTESPNSSALRQGAVHAGSADDPDEGRIVVGSSGLDSGYDEMVSRIFAEGVLERLKSLE